MKIQKKVLTIILLIVVLFLISEVSKVYAVMSPTHPNEIRYSRGVSNVCYVVNSSASAYTSYVNSAANGWVHTHYGDNPIYMTAVSSTVGSHMDIYADNLSFDLIHHRSSYLGSLQKSRYQSMTLPHQQSICIEGTAGGLLPLMG